MTRLAFVACTAEVSLLGEERGVIEGSSHSPSLFAVPFHFLFLLTVSGLVLVQFAVQRKPFSLPLYILPSHVGKSGERTPAAEVHNLLLATVQ